MTNATGTACQPGPAAYTVQGGGASIIPIRHWARAVSLLALAPSPNPLSPGSTTPTRIGNTNAGTGPHNFTLTANSTSGPKSLALFLEASPSRPGFRCCPHRRHRGLQPGSPLTWNADPNADTYDIRSPRTLDDQHQSRVRITGTSYQTTVANPLTTYYWRVQSVNTVGSGRPVPSGAYNHRCPRERDRAASCGPLRVRDHLEHRGRWWCRTPARP